VLFLSVDLRVKKFNLTIRDTNSKWWQFFITKFFLKNFFFFIKILFAVFNVVFVGYSLPKNR
jgi:hypothetical protein